MIKKLKELLAIVFLLISTALSAQQINSFITGRVLDAKDKSPIIGAKVEAILTTTGAKYTTVSNDRGYYRFANVQPGGPYRISITYVGYTNEEISQIHLHLGETYDTQTLLREATIGLTEISVVANKGSQFNGEKMGTSTNVGREKIDMLPGASRTIGDFARLTPQATVKPNGSISVAGINNRYNSFTVDGTLQNDAYGLASNGTNSGQIGFTPFSMDVIDQISIQLSPYDVKQSGFAGAGISASTKSGTNDFRASFYDFFRNEKLAGKTPTDDPAVERKSLPEFTSNTVGLSLSGPIIKNKLFFFINGEIQNDNVPRNFDFETYNPGNNTANKATMEQTESFRQKLINTYNYDPGTFGGITQKLDGKRLFAKLDWNINTDNKFTIRYNLTTGRKIMPSISSASVIYFSNNGQDFSSTVNSVAAELKSTISDRMNNYLYVGFNYIKDDRNPMGDNFPLVVIDRYMTAGSEEFSTANQLTQKVTTVTDNFEYNIGDHTFTVGTSNEFYSMYNLFVGNNFGKYTYSSIDQFLNGQKADRYQRNFSKVDDITGDGSAAAAKFNVAQLGFYIQDEYKPTNNFRLNYGLRIDIPIFMTNVSNNDHFNNQAIPELKAAGWGDVLDDTQAATGQKIKTSIYWSPRVGFNWDITGEKTHQLRGGLGLFTSRIPYVWPGGSYSNNGVMLGAIDVKSSSDPNNWTTFNPNWNAQPTLGNTAPSGQIDLFSKNFKFPQVFRANLGYDVKLPFGITGTLDVMYTKNVNNVLYRNLMIIKDPSGKRLTGTGDDREVWVRLQDQKVGTQLKYPEASKYSGIYLASNTSEGSAWNFSGSLEKNFDFGLSLSAAYSFNRSTSINDGQSSQNSSQWRNSNIYGLNEPTLKTSVYDAGHRVVASASYRANYSKYASTIIAFVYNGSYGDRFGYGYTYNGSANSNGVLGDLNGSSSNAATAIYIPKDENDIKLVDIKSGTTVVATAAEQWTALNNYIENDPYLSKHRGEYAEPNSNQTPWQNIIDMKLVQEFKIPMNNGRIHKLQFSFDVYNLGNLLNKEWGRMYYANANYNSHQILQFAGYQTGTTTPTYQVRNYKDGKVQDPWTIDDNTNNLQTSRWQAQIGVKYIF